MKRVLGTPTYDYLPALAVSAATTVYLITAYRYDAAARVIPAGVAWAMLVLLTLDAVSRTQTKAGRALMRRLNPAGIAAAAETKPRDSALKQWAAILWVAGFVAAMVLIGILNAIPLFVFASLALRGRRSLWLCVLITTGTTLAIIVLFSLVLHIELYPGLLFGNA
jgi:hypothetical protein